MKKQDLSLFFWDKQKKVNNLFIVIEFTNPEYKRYCKGKEGLSDYIMQIPRASGDHTVQLTAKDNQFPHLSLNSKQKNEL